MRTAEEIIKDAFGEYIGQETFINKMKTAINEARKEAIEECAEVAKVTDEWDYDRMDNLKRHSVVDKQSILSLINELK